MYAGKRIGEAATPRASRNLRSRFTIYTLRISRGKQCGGIFAQAKILPRENARVNVSLELRIWIPTSSESFPLDQSEYMLL